MLHKIADKLQRLGINHAQFNALLVLLLVLLLCAAYYFGAVSGAGVVTAVSASALNVAMWVAVAFGLQYFLGGIGEDVINALFNHNIAVAIYMVGVFISIALLIKG
jgi:hypothetical protein